MFQKFRKIHKKAPAPGSLFYLKNKRTFNSGEIPAVVVSLFLSEKKKNQTVRNLPKNRTKTSMNGHRNQL